MAKYSVNHKTDVADVLYINTPTKLCAIYGIMIGNYTTNDSNEIRLNRLSSTGLGGTSLTINKLDPLINNSTVIAEGGIFLAFPPNYGATLMNIPLATNTSFKWSARKKNRILSAIGSEVGIAIEHIQGGSLNVETTLFWEE